MTGPLLPAAACSITGSTPGPPDCLHLSPSYGIAIHRRATKGWQRPREAQKGVRSYRNQALWVVLCRGCLPAIAGRVHSGWMVSCEALYLHRDVMGEGAKQLKRNTDILVQHRGEAITGKCQAANQAFYAVKMLNSILRMDEAVFSHPLRAWGYGSMGVRMVLSPMQWDEASPHHGGVMPWSERWQSCPCSTGHANTAWSGTCTSFLPPNL